MYKDNILPYKRAFRFTPSYDQVKTLNAFAGITETSRTGTLYLRVQKNQVYLIGMNSERFALALFKLTTLTRLEDETYCVPSTFSHTNISLQVTRDGLLNNHTETLLPTDHFIGEKLKSIIKGIKNSRPIETPNPVPQLATHYEDLAFYAVRTHLGKPHAPSYIEAANTSAIVHALFPLKDGLIAIRPRTAWINNLPTVSADLIIKNL